MIRPTCVCVFGGGGGGRCRCISMCVSATIASHFGMWSNIYPYVW